MERFETDVQKNRVTVFFNGGTAKLINVRIYHKPCRGVYWQYIEITSLRKRDFSTQKLHTYKIHMIIFRRK